MSDTKTVLERGIELWNAHDREGWVGLFDERAELEAPGGLRLSGRAGAEQFYDAWNEAFPDNAIKDQLVFGAGSQGVEEAKFGGTHTGVLRSPAGEIPPTGKTVVSRYAAVSRVEDGKIVSFHMYFDLADVLGQLGLMS
ncbi:MAG: ester cyclase [Chloroflexota bacterium]|nr:ester cyclase [Chloroflexota bacterium]